MAVEDKFADELLSDEELDKVAGGTRREIYGDGDELFIRGLIHNGSSPEDVNRVMHEMGYLGYNGNRRCDNDFAKRAEEMVS